GRGRNARSCRGAPGFGDRRTARATAGRRKRRVLLGRFDRPAGGEYAAARTGTSGPDRANRRERRAGGGRRGWREARRGGGDTDTVYRRCDQAGGYRSGFDSCGLGPGLLMLQFDVVTIF